MRTSYLVGKNTWMTDAERRVARKIGRDGENSLGDGRNGMDAVSAVVFYAVGCATVVLGRVTERYMALLAAGEEVGVLQEVVVRAQAGLFEAVQAMDGLVASRTGRETGMGAGKKNLTTEDTEYTEEEEGKWGTKVGTREKEGLERMDGIGLLETATMEVGMETGTAMETGRVVTRPMTVEEAFNALSRRERRYVERQERRAGRKGRKLAA